MRLIADRLGAVRGSRPVFEQVSFAVESGEAFVLTGPNGAGKTTLLRIIAGLLTPTAGRIRLEGMQADRTASEHCHYVGHLSGVKAMLTVEENATFWARYLAGGGGTVERGLATFGLDRVRDIPAAYLSAGQRRRLGLARLLMARRPIWILDEPSASLDRASQDILSTVVNAHLADGGLVMAATHVPLGFARTRELALGAPALPA